MFLEFQKLMEEEVFLDDYIAFHLMHFFRGILIPLVISLYSYFGREKLRIGGLYKGIFGGLALLALVQFFIGHHFKTVLLYGTILLQGILFLYIVNLKEESDGTI